MKKITAEMIQAAAPEVADLPPMSESQVLKAAGILRGVLTSPVAQAS